MISSGKVFVNKERPQLGQLVDENDEIIVNNKRLFTKKPNEIYLAFHKPIGLITSVDPNARDNVISFIDYPERIFPIGRLDVASSGLLLLTNDGRLSERITHPRFDHEKEYVVKLNKRISDEDLKKLASGLFILGSKTKQANVSRNGSDSFHITLTEGRNRQIRRMCEALGYEVVNLKRIRVMNIELKNLAVGRWRELTEREVATLKKLLEI